MTSDAAVPRVFVAGPMAWNLQVRVPELPRSGLVPVPARTHGYALGGAGAGKSVNLARRGARVTLRAVIGDDREGRWAMAELRAVGAAVIGEIDPAGRTEQHLDLIGDDGGRMSVCLSRPGPTRVLHRAQTWAALSAADAVVLDPSDAVRPMLAAAVAIGAPIWVDLRESDGGYDDFVSRAQVVFLSGGRIPDPETFLRARIADGARLVVCDHPDRSITALDDTGRRYELAAAPSGSGGDRPEDASDNVFSAVLLAVLGGTDVGSALTVASAQAAHRAATAGAGS